jgi:HlyD family secretion protein
MTRKAKKLVAAGVVLVGLAALAAAGVTASRTQRGAVEVRVEPVTSRDLVAAVTASGWIKPRRAVDVQSDVMGRIVELAVQEGDAVSRDQLLLRIDPTQYEAAVARAKAAVSESLAREAQVRANLLLAEQALARLRGMSQREPDLVSRQSLEEAETQVTVQRALHEAATYGVAQARATLEEAEDRLAKTVIRAPIEGIVTRLNVEMGETAIVGTTNNPGSLLLTISDLSVMETVVRIDETDVPYIKLGDSTTITIDAFPRQSFTGRVTKIGHSAVRPPGQAQAGTQAQAVDFEVVVTLDAPPPQLRPDLSATAEVVTATKLGVPAIPIIALTVRDRQELEAVPQEDPAARQIAAQAGEHRDIEGVFIVRDGIARFVPVEVGIAGREHFEVLHGLAVGDSVVAGPYDAIRTLQDGAAVRRQVSVPTSRTSPGEEQR